MTGIRIAALVVCLIGMVGLVMWAWNDQRDTALAVQLVLVFGSLLVLAWIR